MNNQNNNPDRQPADNPNDDTDAGVNASPSADSKSGGNYALISMILGISALVFPGFGLVLGIIAIIFGVQFKKANPNSPDKTKAKIGVITGSIAAGLQTLVIIFFFAFSGLALFGFSRTFDRVRDVQDVFNTIEYSQNSMQDDVDVIEEQADDDDFIDDSLFNETTAQCDAAKLVLSAVQAAIDNAKASYDYARSMPNATPQMLAAYESAISDAKAAFPAAQADVDAYCE